MSLADLRAVRFIARHDLRLALRQRETLLWAFAMPLLFFWFIGTVTGGFDGTSGPTFALRAEADAGFLADELDARLAAAGASVHRPDGDPEGTPFDDYRRRVVIPERATERVIAGEAVDIALHRREGGLAAELDQLRLRRAAWGVLADVVVLAARGEEPTAAGVAALRTAPRALTVDVSRAGDLDRVPTGFQHAVPAVMVMFTLVVLLTTGATILIGERRSRVLMRLGAAPIPRGAIVAGRWLGSLLLGAVQISFAVAVGALVFGVEWGPRYLAVAAVLASFAAFCASVSLLLGSLARTEAQAIGFAVIAANVLGALGGCWWPIEITPPAMQTLAACLPTGWAMGALHRLMAFGDSGTAVLPQIGALLAGTLAIGALATRYFRFS